MSATTAASLRQRSGSTKHDITVEAAALFGERGFAAVSVQEIADRVGISAAAIYRHYPSKEAVLDAVLIDVITRCQSAGERASEGWANDDPATQVINMAVQLVVDHADQLATYARERHRASADVGRELSRREVDLFDIWSNGILAAQPGLSSTEVVVRQIAVDGVLSALALERKEIGRSRLRSLVTDGLVAVVTTPPVGEPADALPTRSVWSAPESRREQILRVAMRLFAERGYHGVGMKEIGDAAGMSGPSLYEHVAGKSDILIDAYERSAAFAIVGADEALAAATSASDALDRLLRSHVTVAFDHVDLLIVAAREGTAVPATEQVRIKRRRRDLYDKWVSVLRELRADVSAADALVLVQSAWALIRTLGQQRRNGIPPIESTARLARAFLLAEPSTPRGDHE